MGIGREICELRKEKGLTQRELARRVGVTPAAVGNYEQGISFPREEVLYKLFEALDCTPNRLFGYDDEEVEIPIAARKGESTITLKRRGVKTILDAKTLY